MSNNFTPWIIFFGLMFVIGVIIPSVMGDFQDVPIKEGSFFVTFERFIDEGFKVPLTAGLVKVNPFKEGSMLHSIGITEYIKDAIKGFSYIPTVILLPLFFVTYLSFVYGAVKLVFP